MAHIVDVKVRVPQIMLLTITDTACSVALCSSLENTFSHHLKSRGGIALPLLLSMTTGNGSDTTWNRYPNPDR